MESQTCKLSWAILLSNFSAIGREHAETLFNEIYKTMKIGILTLPLHMENIHFESFNVEYK